MTRELTVYEGVDAAEVAAGGLFSEGGPLGEEGGGWGRKDLVCFALSSRYLK